MSAPARRRAVLIAGPTASGKSALAIDIARQTGGIIVNADAMQLYDTLRVLTARPGADDLAAAPHRLYGTVPAAERFSTGKYVRAVEAVLADTAPDTTLIFAGGTGLYFDALINGFADIPELAPDLIDLVQREIELLDGPGRTALLAAEDPETAARIKVADPQRVIRAIAVKRATGRTLSSFQSDPQQGVLANYELDKLVLMPDRSILRDRIARRFQTMFSDGAVGEVHALLAQNLSPDLPVMKAIGVREISLWLDGQLNEDEAIALAITATHQYAKRQSTWFRNRFGDWRHYDLLAGV